MMVSNEEDPWSDSRMMRAATKATMVTARTINMDFLSRALVREVIAIDTSALFVVTRAGTLAQLAEADELCVAGALPKWQ